MHTTQNLAKKIASGGFVASLALTAIVLALPAATAGHYVDCGAGFNPEWSTPPTDTAVDLTGGLVAVGFSINAFNPQGTGLPVHEILGGAAGGDDHSAAPAFVSFSSPTPGNPNQLDIVLAPGYADVGSYLLYAHALDADGCDALAAFTVTVSIDCSDPSIAVSLIDPADFTVNDRQGSYSGGMFGTPFFETGFAGSSAAGNAVTLALSGGPAWGVMTDNGDGTASALWSPAADGPDAGVYTMDFVVSDTVTGCTGTNSFTVTVVDLYVRSATMSILNPAALYWSSPGVPFSVQVKQVNSGTDWEYFDADAIGLPSGWTATGGDGWIDSGMDATRTVTITPDGATTVANIDLKATLYSWPVNQGPYVVNAPKTINALIPIVVDLELDFDFYFPDEDVAGTITATYLNGAPVVGKAVTVTNKAQLNDASDPVITGVTDAAGGLGFLFPSNLLGSTSIGHHKVTGSVAHSGFDWLDVFEYDVVIDARL